MEFSREELESKQLIDLKKYAKGRRIKGYYTMKKDKLIELLLMKELPFAYKLEKMTIAELRAIAKERGLHGFWNLPKEKLLKCLFPPEDKKENHSETSEHEDPQNQNTNEIGV